MPPFDWAGRLDPRRYFRKANMNVDLAGPRIPTGSAPAAGVNGSRRVSPFRPAGVSGAQVYGGYVQSSDRNPKWVGPNKYRTADELATNVSIVAASIHYFVNLTSHPQWAIVPADDKNDEAKKAAELVEEVMHDMETPWQRVVRRSSMYRFHGFGIQEWTAKRRKDGKTGMLDVASRPQFTIEQWDVDDDGEVLGVIQRSPQTGVMMPIPRGKVIYLVEDTLTDSPEGLGIYRHLAEPYERYKAYLELEMSAFERDLRGIPIGRAPITLINQLVDQQKITRQQGDDLVKGLQEFVQIERKRRDTGLLLDSMPYEYQSTDGMRLAAQMQWGLELLSGTAAGLSEMSSAIDRLQREMARLIGTEQLMMGDQGGNRALAADKSRNLYLIANAVVDNIGSTMDKDYITPICDLNGIPEENRPYCRVEDVAFKDVQEVTAALRDMATAGAVLAPDDPVVDDVRDLLGVSKPPERSEEELAVMRNTAMGLNPDGTQPDRMPPGETRSANDDERAEPEPTAKSFFGWVGELGDKLKHFAKEGTWDESKHPRHPQGSTEGGRFAPSQSAAAQRGDVEERNRIAILATGSLPETYRPPEVDTATELFEQDYDPSVTVDDVVKATGTGDMVAEARAKLKNIGEDTKSKFGPEGVYTEERVAVQNAILEKLFSPDVRDRARVAPGEQPTFYVLGGRGGSGKSWFSTHPDSPIAGKGYININSDDFKEALPEYEGWNAAVVHEESSDMVNKAIHMATQGRLNILFDATLKSRGTIERFVNNLTARGYRVEGYFMHTAPQVSAVRAMKRFKNGNLRNGKGRFVPPEYLLGSTSNERTFDELMPKMDRWGLYDNNTGRGPVKVKEGGR